MESVEAVRFMSSQSALILTFVITACAAHISFTQGRSLHLSAITHYDQAEFDEDEFLRHMLSLSETSSRASLAFVQLYLCVVAAYILSVGHVLYTDIAAFESTLVTVIAGVCTASAVLSAKVIVGNWLTDKRYYDHTAEQLLSSLTARQQTT